METVDNPAGGETRHRQLRHDLLNPLNVLMGMTTVLLDTELTDLQRTCVTACRNAGQKLIEIAAALDTYENRESTQQWLDGPAQLADLCSIAVARIDKPFDREELLAVIRRLVPKHSPRILLVDDAPDIAVLVRAYLKDMQCSVDVVADGERAVAQASSQPYDVVLMDVNLPGLDGATAAHAIRAADLARGARPTPVVALSAMGSRLGPPASTDAEDVVLLEDPDTAPLVPGFLDNRREDVTAIRGLLEQADFSGIQSIGHKIKGTGRGYGFPAISRMGADIELAAHQLDAGALERVLNDLASYLQRVRVEQPR